MIAAAPVKVGSDSYGEVTLESLEILGTIKLNKTTISKLLKVTGNLVANSAHLNEIDAEGNVRLTDSVLDNQVIVTGSLQAQGSDFRQSLTFTGQKALFSGCSLSSIKVCRDAAFKAKQVIELKKTVVGGSIVFEGGNGEVILYPGSKIRGSLTGGKISYKN